MGNSGEKLENNNNKDQYGNELIKVISYDKPIGSMTFGEDYCPVHKNILNYIGESDYMSLVIIIF